MLEVINLSAGYGDIKILNNVNTKVDEGNVVAVLGPNGSGKTTLVKAIMNLNTIFEGKIIFQGKDITHLPAYDRAREGIILSTGEVFPDMSVYENLLLGANTRSSFEVKDLLERVYEVFPRLKERKNQKAGSLSGGERRMLTVGKALMGKPKLLILDEPSAGLAPIATLTLYKALKRIAKTITMLLVEQNAQMAFTISRYVYVLEHGRIVMEGDVNDLKKDEEFKRKYFGF